MVISSSRAGNRWKVWGCGLAILGAAMVGAPAGAASPTNAGCADDHVGDGRTSQREGRVHQAGRQRRREDHELSSEVHLE